jgi:hypothetical protein
VEPPPEAVKHGLQGSKATQRGEMLSSTTLRRGNSPGRSARVEITPEAGATPVAFVPDDRQPPEPRLHAGVRWVDRPPARRITVTISSIVGGSAG